MIGGQGPTALAVSAGGVVWTIFSRLSISLVLNNLTLDDRRARAYCACSRCGWGGLDNILSSIDFFSFSLSGRRPGII